MRLLIACEFATFLALTGVAAANDGPWCYRDFGRPQPGNCSFYSARQCLIVAGTMGGICERNLPLPPSSAKGKRKQS
jgi:hypothetical protein